MLVLLVEPKVTERESLGPAIKKLGYEVQFAWTMLGARHLLRFEPIDVCVVSIDPTKEMDGFTIAALSERLGVPTIVISRFSRAEAVDFFRRPLVSVRQWMQPPINWLVLQTELANIARDKETTT